MSNGTFGYRMFSKTRICFNPLFSVTPGSSDKKCFAYLSSLSETSHPRWDFAGVAGGVVFLCRCLDVSSAR